MSLMSPPVTRPLLTAREVAARLHVSTDTVYRLAAAGKLASVRLSEDGPIRFDPADVPPVNRRTPCPRLRD